MRTELARLIIISPDNRARLDPASHRRSGWPSKTDICKQYLRADRRHPGPGQPEAVMIKTIIIIFVVWTIVSVFVLLAYSLLRKFGLIENVFHSDPNITINESA